MSAPWAEANGLVALLAPPKILVPPLAFARDPNPPPLLIPLPKVAVGAVDGAGAAAPNGFAVVVAAVPKDGWPKAGVAAAVDPVAHGDIRAPIPPAWPKAGAAGFPNAGAEKAGVPKAGAVPAAVAGDPKAELPKAGAAAPVVVVFGAPHGDDFAPIVEAAPKAGPAAAGVPNGELCRAELPNALCVVVAGAGAAAPMSTLTSPEYVVPCRIDSL